MPATSTMKQCGERNHRAGLVRLRFEKVHDAIITTAPLMIPAGVVIGLPLYQSMQLQSGLALGPARALVGSPSDTDITVRTPRHAEAGGGALRQAVRMLPSVT
jgi:hypothetical protein